MNVGADIEDGMAHITMDNEDTGLVFLNRNSIRFFAMYYQVKSGEDNLHAVGTGIGPMGIASVG